LPEDADAKKQYGKDGAFSDYTKEKLLSEIKALEASTSGDTADPSALFRLATFYLHQERMGDAIQDLERVLRAEPGNAEASYLLGNCYLHFDKFEFAARYYVKALKYLPDHLPSLFNLGCCYEQLGIKARAVNTLKKFYLLEKNPEWKQEARFRLHKLGVELE